MTQEQLVGNIRPYIKVAPEKEEKLQKFFSKCLYFSGKYDKEVRFLNPFLFVVPYQIPGTCVNFNKTAVLQDSFTGLHTYLSKLETDLKHQVCIHFSHVGPRRC